MQQLVKVLKQLDPGQVDIDAFELAQQLCLLFDLESRRLSLYSISLSFSSRMIVETKEGKRFPALHHDAMVNTSKVRKLSNYGSPFGKAVIKPVFENYSKPFELFMQLVYNEIRIQLKLDNQEELLFVFQI